LEEEQKENHSQNNSLQKSFFSAVLEHISQDNAELAGRLKSSLLLIDPKVAEGFNKKLLELYEKFYPYIA
jgi:hypothetical protein